MGTLLARHAEMVVAMDSGRREIRVGGLFARARRTQEATRQAMLLARLRPDVAACMGAREVLETATRGAPISAHST
ncbi:hypothetical protein [Lichenicoccus sp.]|uniref:hypothetical protein n=1 Tax=Lichenicoccus sp. TaxID=2781899 RepID=UPI003D0A83DE